MSPCCAEFPEAAPGRREGAAWTVRHPPGRPQEQAAYVPIYEFPLMTAFPFQRRLAANRILAPSEGQEDTMTTVHSPAERVASATALSHISGKLQKNLVFLILVLMGNIAGALALIVATYGMATEDHFTGATLVSGYLADGIPAGFFVAAAVLTVLVAIRTWKMLGAANSGDITALKQLSSPGWAIVAIFACWVFPGIMLLKINKAVSELSTAAH